MVWLIVIAVLLILYIYGTKKHNIFTKIGVRGPKPWPLLGNFNYFAKYGYTNDDGMVRQFGKVYGYFEGAHPVLVVGDAEYAKLITVKMFDKFVNRRLFSNQKQLQKAVTVLKDEEWKTVRNVMTPTFTGGKLKKITKTIDECAKILVRDLIENPKLENGVEVKAIVSTYTMSVVASTLFGCDLTKDKTANEAFIAQAKKTFEEFNIINPFFIISVLFPFMQPVLDYFDIGFMNNEAMNFFKNRIDEILDARAKMEQTPNDFLQLLLDAKSGESKVAPETEGYDNTDWRATKKRALTKEEIVSNSLIFLIAGYETTTLTIAWALHLLAMNQTEQEKLFEEISDAVSEDQPITYEKTSSLVYLDQIVNETLRLYPAAMRFDRVCNETCELGPYTIPKDLIVNISVRALHYDESYWHEPTRFDPDRFAPENKESVNPYAYLPFGSGPRNCIGMRLALLETKAVLARLVQNFKFLPCAKTEEHPKLKKVGICIPENGLWVSIEKR